MNRIMTALTAVLLLLAPLAAQTITVVSPNGGETLAKGGAPFAIEWTARNVDQNVKIVLLQENGDRFGLIAEGLEPGGSPYRWTVGETRSGEAPAGNYKVRVVSEDGAVKDESDRVFAIAGGGGAPAPGSEPTFRVTSPRAGVVWQEGTLQDITWDAGGRSGLANFSLYRRGHEEHGAGTVDLAEGRHRWTVDNFSGDEGPAEYNLIFSAAGFRAVSEPFIIIGGAPPHHDFAVSDPVLEDRAGGKKGFRVTVTNLGGDYRGRLTFSYYCRGMGLGNAVKQGESVSLSRGVPATVELFSVLPQYFGDDCGTNFRFDVNPDRAVAESDFGNNNIQKKFFWRSGHDGRFFSLRLGKNYTNACDACAVVIRPEDVDVVDGSRVRLRLEITLRNCGAQEIRGGVLNIVQRRSGGAESENVYALTGIVIAPGNYYLKLIDVVIACCISSSLEFTFECGESGDLNANNSFHFHQNFVGF